MGNQEAFYMNEIICVEIHIGMKTHELLKEWEVTFSVGDMNMASKGGANGNPLQCSCLQNPVDRGPRLTTVHGVAKVRCS